MRSIFRPESIVAMGLHHAVSVIFYITFLISNHFCRAHTPHTCTHARVVIVFCFFFRRYIVKVCLSNMLNLVSPVISVRVVLLELYYLCMQHLHICVYSTSWFIYDSLSVDAVVNPCVARPTRVVLQLAVVLIHTGTCYDQQFQPTSYAGLRSERCYFLF